MANEYRRRDNRSPNEPVHPNPLVSASSDQLDAWYVAKYVPRRSNAAEAELTLRAQWARRSGSPDSFEARLQDVPPYGSCAAMELLRNGARVFAPVALERQWVSDARPRGSNYNRRRARGRLIVRRVQMLPGYLLFQAPDATVLSHACRGRYIEKVLAGASDELFELSETAVRQLLEPETQRPAQLVFEKLADGTAVAVRRGAFATLPATILDDDGNAEVRILLELFGHSQVSSVPRELIEK